MKSKSDEIFLEEELTRMEKFFDGSKIGNCPTPISTGVGGAASTKWWGIRRAGGSFWFRASGRACFGGEVTLKGHSRQPSAPSQLLLQIITQGAEVGDVFGV